jgi:7-carboxy-7-deazaguanine synthase
MHAGSTIPNRGEDNLRSESARPNAAEAEAMASSIRIAETFTSLQGEGKLTGTRSFFIRTSGCNLRCWFCDTPYASWEPEGGFRRVSELVAEAIDSHCSHVVLTGGEPLLPLLSVELVERLRSAGLHVTIETAGTIDRPCIADLMSISPKLLGSGPEHPDLNGSKKPEGSEMPSTTRARWASRHECHRLPN